VVESRQSGAPDTLPDTHVTLALEPLPHRRRRAILPRQILPTAAGDEDIEDALDGPLVVSAWSACVGGRWEEWLNEGPLPIGEMNLAHAGRLCHLSSVLESPLVKTALSSNQNGLAMVQEITKAIQAYYQANSPNALSDPAFRFAATMVLARVQDGKLFVTQVGDTSFRINGQDEYKNDKEIDSINSGLRKDYVNRTGDIAGGRQIIMPQLKTQYKLQNDAVHKLGYGALDGSTVPEKFIRLFQFPLPEVRTLEVVTDGYFGAFPNEPTVEAYEQLHQYIEKIDPHKIGEFASTKTSDDRTVLIANFGALKS
jgi:hypothetical protein